MLLNGFPRRLGTESPKFLGMEEVECGKNRGHSLGREVLMSGNDPWLLTAWGSRAGASGGLGEGLLAGGDRS